MSIGHRKRIEDALTGFGGSIDVLQEMILPGHYKITHDDIIEIRKQPRQARLQFYQRTIGGAEIRIKTEARNNKRDEISDDPFFVR